MSNLKGLNVVRHQASVTRLRRESVNGHRGAVVWFTGLSASGKSTLAHAVEEQLFQAGCKTYVLDGDNVRHGLCVDLGFSAQDRKENIRRIAQMASLMVDAGLIVLSAFISPYRADRQYARSLFASGDFLEVFCNCPVTICQERDPKGMYARAAKGEIKNFTGISAPYEAPESAELEVPTAQLDVAACVARVVQLLKETGVIAPKGVTVSATGGAGND